MNADVVAKLLRELMGLKSTSDIIRDGLWQSVASVVFNKTYMMVWIIARNKIEQKIGFPDSAFPRKVMQDDFPGKMTWCEGISSESSVIGNHYEF